MEELELTDEELTERESLHPIEDRCLCHNVRRDACPATEYRHTTYDYAHQAWVIDGRYVRCGHAPGMNCRCYGRLHEGERAHQDNMS